MGVLPGETVDAVRTCASPQDARIAAVVQLIMQQLENSALDAALRVGKIVIESFYGGNIAVWRTRNRHDSSFRKLAKHPELPLSAASLYRAVATYELFERLGERLPLRRFSVSQLRHVLIVPADAQEKVLQQALANDWSTERLSREASSLRRPGRGGRPSMPARVRATAKVVAAVDDLLASVSDKSATPASDENALMQQLRRSRDTLDFCISSIEQKA